ncbi:MAG: hypothetical protein PHE30_01300 [Candidatus Omnitrophica bacterium]|nr:hypothetical protein [Candidatus Omnitrophota bacterium]
MDEIFITNFAFICDYAFTGEGGKLSIIGIFKELKPSGAFPFRHPVMFVVSSLTIKKPGNYEIFVKIIRLRDNAEIFTPLKYDLSLKEDKVAEVVTLAQLTNLKFDEPGDYEFQIFIGTELIKKLPVIVKAN